jgi:hypothetical protein
VNIDDIRCIIETLIIPVVSWLAKTFSRNRKPAPPDQESGAADAGVLDADLENGLANLPTTSKRPGEYVSISKSESPAGLLAGSDAWAAYFGRQAALDSNRQPAAASQTAGQPVSAAKRKGLRLAKDFGPGALGSFLVTLGLLAFLYFSDKEFTYESTQIVLGAQLMCLPVSLVTGALFGSVGGLLTKRIAQALHSGDRVQRAAINVASFISGAVSGFLCDGFFVIAASF